MSYNIDQVDYNGPGKLTILKSVAGKLCQKYKDHLPEDNFLYDLDVAGDEETLIIERPAWQGEGSGYFYDTLLEILKHTTGHAKLVFTWEGGDRMTALEVKDGKVKERKVRIEVE